MRAILRPLSDLSKNDWPRQKFLPLWIGLGWWICLIGLFSVQAIVVNSEDWRTAFSRACAFWLLWAAFLPAIVWLSLRCPFERPKLSFQIGLHVLACAGILAFSQFAYRTFMPLPPPPPADNGPAAAARPHMSPGMRMMPDMLIYLATMSACVAFAHFRLSQQRERRAIELEARLAQAKLQALRMQINPHFLFNTLNAIASLVHTNADVADDMITDLAELLRVSLESSDEQEVPLAREMELLGYYLSIEQRRFGQRLQVVQNVAPNTLNALVPALILQPIMENAIRYGVEPHTGTGKIEVHVLREAGKVRLTVCNDGMKTNAPARSGQGGHGIGLANTQARLQQLYGAAQSFSFGFSKPGGWEVKIELPFRPVKPRGNP
jgi:two-component sensor histidine kinase